MIRQFDQTKIDPTMVAQRHRAESYAAALRSLVGDLPQSVTPSPPSGFCTGYRHEGRSAAFVGTAPQGLWDPQGFDLTLRERARPTISFLTHQAQLLCKRVKHRRICLSHDGELAWSQGRLVAALPNTQKRDLTKKEWQAVRRIERPITTFLDGKSALEHCEEFLGRLQHQEQHPIEIKLNQPKQHRPLPKRASPLRQPGVKRRWFPAGNIIALRHTETEFSLSMLPGQPIAFDSRQAARRHYAKRRCKRLGVEQDEIVVARVIRRFTAELSCSREFRHLSPEELVHGYARPQLRIIYKPKLCLQRDGVWAPELRDVNHARRKVSMRPSSFNSELLRPLRELADKVTASGQRMDEIYLLMEQSSQDFGRGHGGPKKLKALSREQKSLTAELNVPDMARALRLLPPSILQSMGITGRHGLLGALRDNSMIPTPNKNFYVHVPYERVCEGKSETRTIELELTDEQAAMLHGREFWLIQETTPSGQALDKDPMPRIVMPLEWGEAVDQDGLLLRMV